MKDGKHGLAYGFMLKKVFEYFKVPYKPGKEGSLKQMFTLSTLEDNKCVELKGGLKSKCGTFKLIVVQIRLTNELEDMAMFVSQKDTEIASLKVALQKTDAEGPGAEIFELIIAQTRLTI